MSIHVIVGDGGREGDLVWDFSDEEYEKALNFFDHLVYEDENKGVMLQEGNDSVWLKRIPGRRTAIQKIRDAFRRNHPPIVHLVQRGQKPPAS